MTEGISKLPPLTDGQKEQVKLTATYLNGIAVGFVLVGGLSVPAGWIANTDSPIRQLAAAGFSLFSIAFSPYLHIRAKKILRSLDR